MPDTVEMPRDAQSALDVSAVLDALRERIEALSDTHPMYSRNAYTHRRTMHRIFANGALVEEGAERPHIFGNLQFLADSTYDAVKAHRDSIDGPVDLVWRVEPELREGPEDRLALYCRLCFEPSLTRVAPGVYVEQRMTIGG